MGRIYRNPPLVEALCEFHFDESRPWDVTVFGHYYDRVRDEFPDKRQQPQVAMSLQRHEGGVRGEFRDSGVRAQFLRSDRTAMVQLASHLLVVNQLPPYRSWQAFKALILAQLSNYLDIAPQQVARQVGLRYINRLEFAAEGFSVVTRFARSGFLPTRLQEAAAPFFLRVEMPQGQQERLVLTMGTIDTDQPDRVAILLDLDHQSSATEGLDVASLREILERAHERIEDAFESCLTDDLRHQFGMEG